MSKAWDIPERVKVGSTTAMNSLDGWREHWMSAANDPDGYWLRETKSSLQWMKEPTVGLEGDYASIQDGFTWFADGALNVSQNCVDRHAADTPDKVAILWERDEPGEAERITYADLKGRVCRAANVLTSLGVQKGDRVIIYMGMVPEAAIAMLACARIGAIHSVVFGGFSAEAVRDRVRDCGAEVVITQDQGVRGGKHVSLKATVDTALDGEKGVKHVLVYQRTGADIAWTEGRDIWWHDAVADASDECEPVECGAEDPLFVLYTSGSTGKPKGLVHTCGGYLTWVAYTHRHVFDLRDDDVFACMADVGWVTGHSYIVYGPLANGATTVMFESTPLYPDAGRYWETIERLGITIFYTAPTALRTLAAEPDELVTSRDLSSVRILGTVGEPIDGETWEWYFKVVGREQCTIVDTWWQTETGGIAISQIAPATPPKPGSASYPMPGIQPLLVDENGHKLQGPKRGLLCMQMPWPGQARTVFGDHDRYVATYFSMFPGLYFSGDGCVRDSDGYYWITGRVDDVLNVSGHRMGTAEFESVVISLDEVAEAAVVGYPHAVKGQGVYCYIVPQPGTATDDSLTQKIQATLREKIGAHARLDDLQYVVALPKTRSGKVMRRILRKIVAGEADQLGDTSTLAEPEVVDVIIDGYNAKR